MEPKQIVADGYNRIAERHSAWEQGVRVQERDHYTAVVLAALSPASSVLELGCGTGLPTTALLATRFHITGVDISQRHIALARQNLPEGTFVCADMMALNFPAASFDGITAFYSLIHLPRAEHAPLLARIATWLRPGGYFIATMGASDAPGAIEDDWLGAPMYWSHFDGAANRQLVEQAGLKILSAQEETADEDGEDITFLWIVAQKPV